MMLLSFLFATNVAFASEDLMPINDNKQQISESGTQEDKNRAKEYINWVDKKAKISGFKGLWNYEKAIEAFKEARVLFKRNKEVIHVARCDQKIASCLIELGEGELALETARKAVDVFETGHDHRRETFASFEFGKAQILLEKYDDGLATLENVLAIVSEDEPKDFEFIVDIESRIAKILRMQDRGEEADEIERRLKSVQEALEDEPELDLLT
jgi:tetratricopeptide (TPR) repeat protein